MVHEQTETASLQTRIDAALKRLKSFYEGAAGIAEVTSLGTPAVPALREILFEREPSGLHQTRCRAAEALAALGAFDVLAEFLRLERPISDAVERLGEDVVVSATARLMARRRDGWVYYLLRDLAERKNLNGVLAGLGSFERGESVPIFIKALAEDELRSTAEAVLRKFGAAARNSLIAAASENEPDDSVNESRLRMRRSALRLLLEIGLSHNDWEKIHFLVDDKDPQIAQLARAACLRIKMPEKAAGKISNS